MSVKQLKSPYATCIQSLRNWYGNHVGQRARRIAAGPSVALKVAKPKGRRALQPIEVYARKYYKTRVKEKLDEMCKVHGYDRKERFAQMKRLTKEAFANEPDDIKREVDEEARASRERGAILEDGDSPSGPMSAPERQLRVFC